MSSRGSHLRGVLLPLSVAVVAIAALVWYDLVWIPAQQQYFDERNLRLLRTMSAQIKASVDNFDQAIDHAIESGWSGVEEPGQSVEFREYVKAYAPNLEILADDDHSDGSDLVRRNPGRISTAGSGLNAQLLQPLLRS
jgi:hypothetical protein